MALGPGRPPRLSEQAADIEAARRARRQNYWIILLRETREPIGYVRINWEDGERRTAWLRFALGRRRGEGLASDALRALLAHLFTRGLHRADAETRDFNVASRRLLQGLGFRLEGIKRQALLNGRRRCDALALGLLKDDFRAAARKVRKAPGRRPARLVARKP